MVEETYFRMPNIPSPTNTGTAPIFNKSINYNKRKDSFSNSKVTFDSYKNFFNFFLYIYLFKEEYMKELNLIESDTSITSDKPNSDNNDSNELNTDSISNTTKEDENSSTKPNSISNNDNTSNNSPLIEDIEAILLETKNDLNETNNSTDIL